MGETRAAYRSGRFKGLPKRCECGGKLLYERDFGRIFSCCDTCTPVVTVPVPKNALGERYNPRPGPTGEKR